jgi:hypothetical protein
VESIPTTGFIVTAGQQRFYRNQEKLGQCGDLGQFTSYLPGAGTPSSYVYLKADSLYAMEGTGGVGFLMMNEDGDLRYASNAKDVCIPSSVIRDFDIYSVDADGSLHEISKISGGKASVSQSTAGQLENKMSNLAIKLTLSGKMNGTDIKYMRKLIAEKHLASLDLTSAKVVSGGSAYDGTHRTSNNVLGDNTFKDYTKLVSVKLPSSLTKIGKETFTSTGLKTIEIPEKVTSIGEDAFAYCNNLRTVVIGKAVNTLSKGVFYGSEVKDVYMMTTTPPSTNGYTFSSEPTIHVYANAVSRYTSAGWGEFGTIVGDLDEWETSTNNATGIVETANTTFKHQNEEAVYNLSGQRVNNPGKGLYVVGGRKVVLK